MLLKAVLWHSNPVIVDQVSIQNKYVQVALEEGVERGDGHGWVKCLSLW